MIVTSALVQGLGLLVSFNEVGRQLFADMSKWEIPTREVKSLSFGYVPMILKTERLGVWFGSRDEVIDTSERLGCNFDTISKY